MIIIEVLSESYHASDYSNTHNDRYMIILYYDLIIGYDTFSETYKYCKTKYNIRLISANIQNIEYT